MFIEVPKVYFFRSEILKGNRTIQAGLSLFFALQAFAAYPQNNAAKTTSTGDAYYSEEYVADTSAQQFIIDDFLREGFTYAEIQEAQEAARASANVSKELSTLSSSSTVDWNSKTFVSDVSFDVEKAGIPMPSGKSLSVNHIQMELPILVKDPLLSLYVDDTRTLGDMVLEGSITLESLTRIIDNSRRTPAYFENGTSKLKTTNTIQLQQIGSLLVKHHKPYVQERPIDRIASRSYSGIVIDARGTLPVQGEFTASPVYPCLFPRIWNESMTLVYERNMVSPEIVKKSGMVDYIQGQGSNKKTDRAGRDPLWIRAKKVYGVNRCDPVISYEDYLRITTVPANLNLLQQGKVVILLDDTQIAYSVSAPEKDVGYYLDYFKLKKEIEDPVQPETSVKDTPGGLTIVMENLQFVADSSELLPQEKPRVDLIAAEIKKILNSGEYTIRVDGHTADVNKPNGQRTLSFQRAEAVVNQLVNQGINKDLFTWFGYGGTKPVGDNSTAEGRAQNRRVEITVIPKGTTIERR